MDYFSAFLYVFVVISIFSVEAQKQTDQCIPLANCLNDVADRLEKCSSDFKDLVSTTNTSDQCLTDVKTKWFLLMDLQVKRSRLVASCLKVFGSNGVPIDAQCPAVAADKKSPRKKRQAQPDKLQSSIAKVTRECKNAQKILADIKQKVDTKTLLTRYQAVDYVKKNCDGTSTLTVDDLPPFGDPKLENAIWKIQQGCKNSDDIIKNVQTKQKAGDFFSRQQLIDYIKQNCQGTVQLTMDDIPDFGIFNNPFFLKIESANVKVQKECKNSDAILRDLKKMYENKTLESSQQWVDIVKQRCDGRSTLTVNELPAIGCDKDVKKQLKVCLDMVPQCSTAVLCNECYELSPTHTSVHQTTLDLIRLKAKCDKTSKTTGAAQDTFRVDSNVNEIFT